MAKNGSNYTKAKYWWSAKGKICKQNDICGIFDDSPEYKPTCEELGVLYVYYPEFRKETKSY
jgi:hypothetical protein